MSSSLRLLVYGLFFLSGATALVYQVAWVRNLTLIFGASREAVAIVLASFMAGLALGGFTFGRWSKRLRRPLIVYGFLEIGIGVLALVLPTLLHLGDSVYVRVALRVDGVPWTLQLMRVALAFSILLLPTFLMGGTLPVLTQFLIARRRDFATRLSVLYAVNTTGAVVGTLAAGFFLLRVFGVWHSQLIAVSVTMLVGVLSVIAGRRAQLPAPAEPDLPTAQPDGAPVTAAMTSLRRRALRVTFLGTAVSGMCALALEVMWMRGLSIAAGTTTYSFTVMLAAFLVGIALGSWLHAAFPLRRINESVQFGVVMIGIGLTTAIGVQLIPQMPRLAVELNTSILEGAGGVRAPTTLLLSFAVMLIPCTLMGMAFPLAGQARLRLRENLGESVGDLVGLNTVGAIVGSLGAGFFLIPFLGLQRGMLLVAAVNAIYGTIVLASVTAARFPSLKWWTPAITAALAIGFGSLAYLLPDWDIRVLAAYRNNLSGGAGGISGAMVMDQLLAETDVVYYREGRSSNVSVVGHGGHLAMLIDGKSVASDSLTDMQHELLLGHLPVLLHPNPRSAAVVGLGAGITLGGVLAHPSLERVVLIEIEPAVVEGARQFSHVNNDAVDDPRLTIAFQDGRNYLLTSSEQFDVITADPIHPWAHGASYLYTIEYFRMIAEHLTPQGIMCQWLPLYELSPADVRMVVATFSDAFPHTTLWQTTYDAILIGSPSSLAVDAQSLSQRLRTPTVARQLAPIGLDDPLSFLSELTMDTPAVLEFGESAIRNTDDNLHLEFSSPLSIGTAAVHENIRSVNGRRMTLRDLDSDLSALVPADRAVDEELENYRWAKSQTVIAQMALRESWRTEDSGSMARVIQRLQAIMARVPEYGRTRSLLCVALTRHGLQLLKAGRIQEAVQALQQAVQVMPTDAEANYHLAAVLAKNGRGYMAVPFFQASLAQRPRNAAAQCDYGATLLGLERFADALAPLRQALALRPDFAEAHQHLAIALMRTGQLGEAQVHFDRALQLKSNLAGLHYNYSVLMVEQGRFEDAIELLRAGLAVRPDDLRTVQKLAWLLATVPDARLRDGPEALRLSRLINAATGGEIPQVLDTLATALAEMGRFEEAVSYASTAADLATRTNQISLAEEIRRRVDRYRAEEPFREPADPR